jgi:predicted TIM-barrel fold metal-dependent hydrolase
VKIIDTHQHLYDVTMFPYPWLKDYPTLVGTYVMKDYLEATQGLPIYKSVFLECDVDERFKVQETRQVLSLADQDNPLQGVVAGGRPEKPGFKTYLEQIVGHPKLKGMRRVLHTEPDDLARGRTFVDNIRWLEQLGLSFDLCALPRQLPVVTELVRECPGVSFILDHCGVPQVKERVLHPWQEDIEEIAKLPNVVCKISGLVAYADPQNWTPDDLRPYVEHVIKCFGWDRVMFGSDWPVCTLSSTYTRWVETLIYLTQDAGESNQRKLFQENAERVYRLG